MSFGSYLQALCLELTRAHGWIEHANALLYTQGAPDLMDHVLQLYQQGATIEDAARLVDDRLNRIDSRWWRRASARWGRGAW